MKGYTGRVYPRAWTLGLGMIYEKLKNFYLKKAMYFGGILVIATYNSPSPVQTVVQLQP